MRKIGMVTNGRDRICRVTGEISLTWLPLESELTPAPKPTPRDNAADEVLIEWFQDHRDQLPDEPFDLRPGERVTGPQKFYEALLSDILAGPIGRDVRGIIVTRARWSPLIQDLADLKRLTESD